MTVHNYYRQPEDNLFNNSYYQSKYFPSSNDTIDHDEGYQISYSSIPNASEYSNAVMIHRTSSRSQLDHQQQQSQYQSQQQQQQLHDQQQKQQQIEDAVEQERSHLFHRNNHQSIHHHRSLRSHLRRKKERSPEVPDDNSGASTVITNRAQTQPQSAPQSSSSIGESMAQEPHEAQHMNNSSRRIIKQSDEMAQPLTIDQFLGYMGKRIIQSEPDGSCLFRSISNGLVQTQEKHHQVRILAVQWMHDNLHTLIDDVPFKETIFLKESQHSIEDYLKDMLNDGEWGDFSCIVALSQVLRVQFKIVVVRDDVVTSVLDVTPRDQVEAEEIVWLMFDEPRRHYNLIVNQ